MGEELRAQMGSVRQATGAVPGAEAVTAALRGAVEEACETRLVPGSLSTAETAALPGVERWLRRVPRRPAAAPSGCWKVRAGCGVVRVVLSRPRRLVVLVTVRGGAVAGVTAERPGGRGVAARLATALQARRLDAPVPVDGLDPEAAAAVGAALEAARRLFG
jgi:hypothetical protein